MAFLTRDQILKANDLPTTEVEVPEWGGTVRLRALTAAEAGEWDKRLRAATEAGESLSVAAIYLLALTMVDAKGNRLFPDEDDVKALEAKSPKVMGRVLDAFFAFNNPKVDDLKGN